MHVVIGMRDIGFICEVYTRLLELVTGNPSKPNGQVT